MMTENLQALIAINNHSRAGAIPPEQADKKMNNEQRTFLEKRVADISDSINFDKSEVESLQRNIEVNSAVLGEVKHILHHLEVA